MTRPIPPTRQNLAPRHPEELAKARKLLAISRALGWGGLGVLLVLAPGIAIVTHSIVAAGLVAGLGMSIATAGAVVGQIGRAMQGRVI